MLFDKTCKYETILAGIVEDAEQTRFCPQTDKQMDGWKDRQGETSISPSPTPIHTHTYSNEAKGIKTSHMTMHVLIWGFSIRWEVADTGQNYILVS